MKKLAISLAVLIVAIAIAAGVASAGITSETECLRIHIRANSNDEIDQSVKYEIKGEIVKYLTPIISEAKSKDQAMSIVSREIPNIEAVAKNTLKKKGFTYTAKCKIASEEFPSRTYGNMTLEKGVYDALIVELGKAEGDNWWCVVFPPLCFVSGENSGEKDFKYVSKIEEIINGILGR